MLFDDCDALLKLKRKCKTLETYSNVRGLKLRSLILNEPILGEAIARGKDTSRGRVPKIAHCLRLRTTDISGCVMLACCDSNPNFYSVTFLSTEK